MALLNALSSSLISKRKYLSGLGRSSYMTILGKRLNRTTIYTVYRPCKGYLEYVGSNVVLKQQWLVIQKHNQQQHPHDTAINDIINDIKSKQNNLHDIIITMDGNEVFESTKGEISKLCRNCKLHGILGHNHGYHDLLNSYSRGCKRVDFILCLFNLLKSINSCNMKKFGVITVNYL